MTADTETAASAAPATAGNVGTTKCVLEPRPQIWDLGGTLTATFADKSNPSEPAAAAPPGTTVSGSN